MMRKILLLIIIVLLLPFHALTASADDSPQILIKGEDGTIDQIMNAVDWVPLTSYNHSADQLIWLKVDSPQYDYLYLNPSPYLLEIYQNDKLVYQYGEKAPDTRIKNSRRWDLIPIKPNETVYIHLKGDIPENIVIGSKHQFLGDIMSNDLFRIIGNIGLLIMAFISFVFYLFNRKQRLPLTFAGFALSLAISGLIRTESKQLLFDLPLFYFYLNVFISTVSLVLFFLFFSSLMADSYKKIASWIWKVYGSACILAILVLTLLPKFLVVVMISLNIIMIGSMLIFTIIMVGSFLKQKNKELLLSILGVAGFISTYFSGVLFKIIDFNIEVGLIANYILVTACISIIIHQYVELHRKVQRYSEELEVEVQERTSELKETHQQLVESMQQSAVSMVEITTLQERNRIAQEIHDIVGHTLTTTILQIEASKRLLDKNIDLAKEKMDISQELVRKGLDEIRGSVRMLKEADWSFDLKSSLEKLLQETIKHGDVQMEADIADISDMPEMLKSTIYLSLKEGLTNGLKHGHCKRFHFTLIEENKAIKFVLKNDGKPFQAKQFGFGLSAMSERIQQQNGTVEIYPNEEWGCILSMHLPL